MLDWCLYSNLYAKMAGGYRTAAVTPRRQYTPCLIGFQVPMRNRAIAESVVEGRDMVDWERLFIIIRNFFRQVEISITEVMY